MKRPENDKPEKTDEVREPVAGFGSGLGEASRYFMGKADVQRAALRIAMRLGELGIDYAIGGGLAVTAHGHVRTTQDVDVLLTAEGLGRFKAESLGRGWVEKFAGSRGFRDTECGVPIDVMLAGDFPGDGEPTDLAFPPPEEVEVDDQGVRFLSLRALIELKIACAMTAPDRPRDLDDVIQLIRRNGLDVEFASRLHPRVRAKYRELWDYAQRPTREF